jgi:6-hydroxynicotinate reductase
MVDVSRMPENAFGYVPTPAIVAPIEFTVKKSDYANLGGHMDSVRPLEEVLGEKERQRQVASSPRNPWPLKPTTPGSHE